MMSMLCVSTTTFHSAVNVCLVSMALERMALALVKMHLLSFCNSLQYEFVHKCRYYPVLSKFDQGIILLHFTPPNSLGVGE